MEICPEKILMTMWESTDAKKETDDIDNKFDKARVANSVTGRGEFTFHIWILGLSEVCAVS